MVKTIIVSPLQRAVAVGDVIPVLGIPPHSTLLSCFVGFCGDMAITVEIPDDGPDVKKAGGL